MRIILLILLLISSTYISAQEKITISEGTFKVGAFSEDQLYFGLKEGDQLVFSFTEMKGKKLKEIEIIEHPGASKFFEFQQKKVSDKVMNISNTGIYKLRLKNAALGARICRYKIERIPLNPDIKFNTTVYWKTLKDTTYYTVDEDYLISIDSAIIPVVDHKVERVHSQTVLNGKSNKSVVQVALPPNTVSWSYYLGVGEDSEAVFAQAEKKAEENRKKLKAAAKLTTSLASIDPSGSAALAGVLLGGLADFAVPKKADNIQYWFAPNYENARAFMNDRQFYQFEQGNGPLSYKRMQEPKKGAFYICLLNDNVLEGIDVHIRMSALTVTENWGKQEVEKYRVNSWKEPYLQSDGQ